MGTTTINSEQFGKICDRVWSDRALVFEGRGHLSGEAALLRAVFWRLTKAGLKTNGRGESAGTEPTMLAYQSVVGRMLEINGRPAFDSAPMLTGLLTRYQAEVETVAKS